MKALVVLTLTLCTSLALAKDSFQVNWTLTIETEQGVRRQPLKQTDVSFQEGNFKCEINSAQLKDGGEGIGRVKIRSLICRSANEERRTGAACFELTRKEVASPEGISVNGKTFRLNCEVL